MWVLKAIGPFVFPGYVSWRLHLSSQDLAVELTVTQKKQSRAEEGKCVQV